MIDINIVQSNRAMPDANLTGAGLTNVDIFPAQDFWATWLVNADRFGHQILLEG